MYQIKCDDYILYDPRDDELTLIDPRLKLEVNTVGEGSFTILPSHPHYDKLKRLKSVFSVLESGQTIFRGRMTNDSRDFQNRLVVDLEGVMAYTNDSLVQPFNFPNDFTVPANANPVEYLLTVAIQNHNSQVQPWQQLKVGTVTVTDPNNYIVRSSDDFMTTWQFLKEKLFESSLGGYLCVRYEADGNYIDYLSEFTLTNPQQVVFGENLIDIQQESESGETYTAILPRGAEIENEETGISKRIDISSIPDGDISDDLVKAGLSIYSKSAVEAYGVIYCPMDDATWDDVTDAVNLQRKAAEQLQSVGVKLDNTITINAVDMRFSDAQIQSFRINRNVIVHSPVHGLDGASYPLTALDISIMNPQDTVVTIGDKRKSLLGINEQLHNDSIQRIERTAQVVEGVQAKVDEVKQQALTLETSITTNCETIIMSALREYSENGDMGQFKQTVSSQLAIMAGQIEMNFLNTSAEINNVNGDVQQTNALIEKHFKFSENGLTIQSGTNKLSLTLDNDMISFKKNGTQFGWWDGVDFHTGNIIVDVNERAQFGSFAFVPRSNGSLMFLKVGG